MENRDLEDKDLKKIKKGLKRTVIGTLMFAGAIMTLVWYVNRPAYQEKIKEREILRSIYQAKKDSLENAYQTELKNLENKF